MMRRASIAADCVAIACATLAALALRGTLEARLGFPVAPFSLDWSLVIPFVTLLGSFSVAGLYDREAYVARPLHAWTLLRATLVAFVVAAAAGFLLGAGWLNAARLTLVLTFAFFPFFDLALRMGALHDMFLAWIRRRQPAAFVVGGSTHARRLAERLDSLRGFTMVTSIEQPDGSGSWIDALCLELGKRTPSDLHEDAVYIDSTSVPPRDTMGLIAGAQSRGLEVYVVSDLLGPLEASRMLKTLYQAPVTRVRGCDSASPGYALKRTLDILGSAIALALLSPVVGALAVVIKATSPGPVFLTQTRVGRSGRTFGFLKFRSMYVNSDSGAHERYIHAMINGEARPIESGAEGSGVFHLVDDPRITPVGRIIRKYSLDEIPQLWNVLRGDMSLVGPRPPLPYEVAVYDEWQKQRLEVQAGITGVWQVIGRNRVSFDEMTFQDLMYGMNKGLLVDLRLCLKTIPAALIGTGL